MRQNKENSLHELNEYMINVRDSLSGEVLNEVQDPLWFHTNDIKLSSILWYNLSLKLRECLHENE